MATEALIKPNLLTWAIERANITYEQLAKKLKTQSSKIINWTSGDERPTFRQAQNIAKILQIPFGYLYLSEPPREELPIPDLRTLRNQPIGSASADFKALLESVTLKQEWYKDYVIDNGDDKKEFLGRFSINSNKNDIIRDITKKLSLEQYIGKAFKKEAFLNKLIKEIENLDILVMRNSIVGNNTHKTLSIDEFRGFAIFDLYAPLIFINTQDTHSAQIFTLMHELVHLWIGESGISALSYDDTNKIEIFCNDIAAEILVPINLLDVYWDGEYDKFTEQYIQLANQFSVSTAVILNKLRKLDYISFDTYEKYTEFEKEKFLHYKRNKPKSIGGPNFYVGLKAKNGSNFSQALVVSTLEGKTLYAEAGRLLGINYSKIDDFANKLGIK